MITCIAPFPAFCLETIEQVEGSSAPVAPSPCHLARHLPHYGESAVAQPVCYNKLKVLRVNNTTCSQLPTRRTSVALCSRLPNKPPQRKALSNDTASMITNATVEYRSILEKILLNSTDQNQQFSWTWSTQKVSQVNSCAQAPHLKKHLHQFWSVL